ncbi:MAG: hypothetical protein LC792_06615, partial [Actinobacteria bacterium]|nr:hypothetical protein [Actinomycetota bacterium]
MDTDLLSPAAVPWADVDVVERTPLRTPGVSGSRLERVTMADGRRLVVKVLDPGTDWLMQATGDDGRIFRLWSAGLDDLLSDITETLGPEDRAVLPLALLGALLQLGWEKALGATSDDPATRARERAGLAWWWA